MAIRELPTYYVQQTEIATYLDDAVNDIEDLICRNYLLLMASLWTYE